MRKHVSVCGTMALVIAALVPYSSMADDKVDDLGLPIHSIRDLQNTAKIVFKAADTNNDGQISQKEAIDMGDLLVGGFFFRADANGDGVLSPDEARQARETLFTQQPLLKFVLERAKPTNPTQVSQPAIGETPVEKSQVAKNLAADPAKTIGNLLDTNHDQKLQATELRQGVQTGVQALFLMADTNQDGLISPYELNAAVGEVAKSAVQTVFQAADTDRSGALSQDEYDKALAEPAHAVFRILDANGDNQLSFDEIQRAERILGDQLQRLRVPDPPNSLSNQIGSPRTANVNGSPTTVVSTPAPSSPAATTVPPPR
jgi:Ca2+-binding EF-hand superfamily protein